VILYTLLEVLQIKNIYLLSTVMLCFVILSGVFISKLAIDPLLEYVKNLQNLSKETLHELNLPISTIITNTQMLEKNIEDEKAIKRLSRIKNACEMLKQRYNELEYMIKMQSKQEVLEEFSLNELVEQRVHFLEKIYPQIEFHLELQTTNIRNDKTGLSKVIDNIIDNGVKYSKNSTRIDIRLKNNILEIQDYGIGMDEVELIRIFDNYYQGNKNMQGFGIGLSMVKRFCDTNKIALNFNSAPDIGTTVLLNFENNKENLDANK
jgi:signal transduction histidine kinase